MQNESNNNRQNTEQNTIDSILPKSCQSKSIHDLIAESCPKKEDGSYDVSNFDFNEAYKNLGFTKVI